MERMLSAMPRRCKSALSDERQILCADFETTADIPDDGSLPESTRVWLWSVRNVDDWNVNVIGYTIDEFMASILVGERTVFFHNLKFDGGYIIDWLLHNGFRCNDPNIVTGAPPPLSFTPIISSESQFYRIWVATEGADVIFMDSLKKIPLSVQSMAGAYGLEMSKGVIDYVTYREPGYRPTFEERQYVRNDTGIVAEALRQQIAEGLDSMTASSDALKGYKEVVGNKTFKKWFPTLSQEDDTKVRAAYRGGFTYADSRTAGVVQGAGMVLDVNSLYPFIMYSKLLPYGKPISVDIPPEEISDDYLWVATFRFTAKLKERGIPCIQLRGSHRANPTEYLRTVDEPTEMRMTNVDWKLINDMYDVDLYSYSDVTIFRCRIGAFKDYIDKWMGVKEASTGGKRQIAKLMLNSLYGKFAARIERRNKLPVLHNGVVKYVSSENEKNVKPVYTPVGVFVTAWARDYTIRSAAANYDRFLYADTDSLHLKGTEPPVGLNIHPTHLGAWKIEGVFDKAIFVRAKQYCEVSDGKPDTHIAGLPRKNPHTGKPYEIWPEDLLRCQTYGGKLVPKMIPGGTFLTETHFTFTPVKES